MPNERMSLSERRRIRRNRHLAVAIPGIVCAGLVAVGTLSLWTALAILIASLPAFLLLRKYAEEKGAIEQLENEQAPPTSRSQDYVDAIMGAAPDALVLINAEHHVVEANRAALDAFGDRLVGRDMVQVIRIPDAVNAIERALVRQERCEAELTLLAPGERQFLLLVIPIVQPSDGAASEEIVPFRGALLAFHETTALKRSEKMRADFVANASHELRTPLASIIGFIETLSGPAKEDAEARERFLGIMGQEATRMARLVDDLLSLSRIEQEEHLAPQETADLGHLLGRLSKALELKAQAENMTIDLDLPKNLPLVLGDDDQLTQVFQNLVDNALKYGQEGTSVRVSVETVERLPETGGGGLAVSIHNQGDGIPREHIPRLTDRFYRVDTARSRELGGTGLGLAIVKHIVNRHRGTFGVESELGVGTTASVGLPIAPEQISAESEETL